MTGPLAGLRVVELSSTFTAALIGQLFADYGAEVVSVEPPGGSPLRRRAAYPFWARGKKSIELDLREGGDADTARSLCFGSDVVIETFRPGVAERFGLGYREVQAGNAGIVYVSVTGFGRTGPLAATKGYEGVVAAKLGLPTAFERMAARPGPAFVSVPYCSWSAAQTALHGALAALYEREASGIGQWVQTSLVQGLAAHDTWNWFILLMSQRHPEAYTYAAPFTDDGVPMTGFYFRLPVLLTADGRWLQFSQTQPRLFHAFLRALDMEWMFDDPKWEIAPEFADISQRVEFWERMINACREKTFAEWMQVFDSDSDVWAEIYRTGSELLDHPQMRHDEQVVEINDAVRGPVLQPGPLAKMSATPATLETPAPLPNQHGDVLRAAPWDRSAQTAGTPSAGAPLAGVTILELGAFYAAPFGATLLADLGARVIKVEPLLGEPMRMIQPFPEIGGIKVLQGKESVAVDIATDDGREIVHALARRSDLVLRAYRAGVAERLGVDAATLRALNPDLIYLDAPGYGVDGPCGHRPAFAPTIGAGAGLAMRNLGTTVPQGSDLTMDEVKLHSVRLSAANTVVSAQSDGMSALGVATALLLGLLGRRRGAGGQAMLTTMVSTNAHALSEQMVRYEGLVDDPVVDAALYGIGALYRLYETARGWVFLAVTTGREWSDLSRGLSGHVDLAGDPRFVTPPGRQDEGTALAEVLDAVFRTRPAAEWERKLAEFDVACVEVDERPCELVLMADEMWRAAGMVVDVVHPTLDEHPRLGPLVQFSRSETVSGAAPLLGQDTDAVLAELGYSQSRIDDLRSRGVIL